MPPMQWSLGTRLIIIFYFVGLPLAGLVFLTIIVRYCIKKEEEITFDTIMEKRLRMVMLSIIVISIVAVIFNFLVSTAAFSRVNNELFTWLQISTLVVAALAAVYVAGVYFYPKLNNAAIHAVFITLLSVASFFLLHRLT